MAAPNTFDLVIPLWNEADNLAELVANLDRSGLVGHGLHRAILVNNGSHDQTGALLDELTVDRPWIQAVHLTENQGYGGGIVHGFRQASAPYVAYMPGDNQVSCTDLARVWRGVEVLRRRGCDEALFVKGWRYRRLDPHSMRFVSTVYTRLANGLLRLGTRDVNALPKCFDRRLVDALPDHPYTTFTLEPLLLVIARRLGFRLAEVPVTFYARSRGASSWSGKRLRVYWQTFWQMYALRCFVIRRLPRLFRLARRTVAIPWCRDSAWLQGLLSQ